MFYFSCVDVSSDVVDIDGGTQMSVYVFVNSSRLTNIEAETMLMVTMSGDTDTVLSCSPTMPTVKVSLLVNRRDITNDFAFDPTRGFIIKERSFETIDLTSSLCL